MQNYAVSKTTPEKMVKISEKLLQRFAFVYVVFNLQKLLKFSLKHVEKL